MGEQADELRDREDRRLMADTPLVCIGCDRKWLPEWRGDACPDCERASYEESRTQDEYDLEK